MKLKGRNKVLKDVILAAAVSSGEIVLVLIDVTQFKKDTLEDRRQDTSDLA